MKGKSYTQQFTTLNLRFIVTEQRQDPLILWRSPIIL